MWPWRHARRVARPEPPSPAPQPPRGEWRALAPIQRTVAAHPLVNPAERFRALLSAWQDPRFVSPLGHAVGDREPSGLIDLLSSPSGDSWYGRPAARGDGAPGAGPDTGSTLLSHSWSALAGTMQPASDPGEPGGAPDRPRDAAVTGEAVVPGDVHVPGEAAVDRSPPVVAMLGSLAPDVAGSPADPTSAGRFSAGPAEEAPGGAAPASDEPTTASGAADRAVPADGSGPSYPPAFGSGPSHPPAFGSGPSHPPAFGSGPSHPPALGAGTREVVQRTPEVAPLAGPARRLGLGTPILPGANRRQPLRRPAVDPPPAPRPVPWHPTPCRGPTRRPDRRQTTRPMKDRRWAHRGPVRATCRWCWSARRPMPRRGRGIRPCRRLPAWSATGRRRSPSAYRRRWTACSPARHRRRAAVHQSWCPGRPGRPSAQAPCVSPPRRPSRRRPPGEGTPAGSLSRSEPPLPPPDCRSERRHR